MVPRHSLRPSGWTKSSPTVITISWFHTVALQGVMADSGASSSSSNCLFTKPLSRSEARKAYEKKRNATRMFVCDAFERWRVFSKEHNLKTTQNVANFLLDNYT